MNNEPVAWMDDCSFFTEQPDDMEGVIPLYTHPAKTLTDEEIALVWDKFSALPSSKDIKDFARAILKRASEK